MVWYSTGFTARCIFCFCRYAWCSAGLCVQFIGFQLSALQARGIYFAVSEESLLMWL